MSDFTSVVLEYVEAHDRIPEENEKDITQYNYERVIEELREEERKSFGIKKNEIVIRFLMERFK